jgi:hypothetical protein
MGWKVNMRVLFSEPYLRALYDGEFRVIEVISGYWRRFRILMSARNHELVWIKKKACANSAAFVERLFDQTNVPSVVDYDDALIHRYDRHRSCFVRSQNSLPAIDWAILWFANGISFFTPKSKSAPSWRIIAISLMGIITVPASAMRSHDSHVTAVKV